MGESNKDIITSILIDLKIYPKMAGFDYMREAVKLCLNEQELLNNITTKLYKKVAEKFSVKPSVIERCIRFAINSAYKNGGLLNINNFYNIIVYTNNFKYSSGELISIITEQVKLELHKKYYINKFKQNKANFYSDKH